MAEKKRLLTGLQSSGDLHIGNYFGALKPFLDMYQDYESFLMIADYHALTSVRDPEILRKNVLNVVKDYLAVGVDPEKAYPMLQAADITLYDVDIVPVGEDQRQHLEYTREAVGKFNRAYGENLLKEPAEKIYNSVGVVPGTDGAKMSKSYGNTIPLFGTKEETEKAVMGIVTDSSGHRPENVYAIHRLLKSAEELDPIYAEYTGRYGDLKKMLAADLETYFGPMREKRNAISDEEVKAVLVNGVEKAKNISNQTLKRVRDAIGITI